jgi:uncharacterized membrane protein YgcG
VEGAEKAQCAALWHATAWYCDAKSADDIVLITTFALNAVKGKINLVRDIQTKVADVAGNDDEEPTEEAASTYVDELVQLMATEKVQPPAEAEAAKDTAEVEKTQETEEGPTLEAHVLTPGLTVRPDAFIEAMVGHKTNGTDNEGNAIKVAFEESDTEDSDDEGDKKKRKKLVAKGKKRSAEMLRETLMQMPQAARASMPVFDFANARLLEVMSDKQERRLLDLFASAKYLAKPNKGKANLFLEMLEDMKVPKPMLGEVRQIYTGTDKGEGERKRAYSNAMIVTSDMLRRAVAGHRIKDAPDEAALKEMEHAAAVLTRLGTHQLQMLTQEQVNKFCDTFGMAKTEELQRMMVDPAMMRPAMRDEVRKKLKQTFELKKAANGAMRGSDSLEPGEKAACPMYGSGCFDLQRGGACTHKRNGKGGGKGGGKGSGKGGGKGGGSWKGKGNGGGW